MNTSAIPRWQWALFGVTFAVFVTIIIWRAGSLFTVEHHAEAVTPLAGRAAPVEAEAPAPRVIARMSLADASRHDPFAFPAWIRPPVLEKKSSPTAAPKSKTPQREAKDELAVSAVFINESDRCAIVADHIVRIGDVIRGFRIADIHKDGVEVTPITE